MGIISLLASVFIVVSTFINSHLLNILTPVKPSANTKEDVLSMDDQKEEKIATPSGGSTQSAAINSNSQNNVKIKNGGSNVDVEIKNNSSSVNISQNNGNGNTPGNSSLDNLKYPGASVTSSSEGTNLTLESSDTTDTITNWYKNKIVSLGMNTKSFVTTKSNDKVLNKLVGANGNQEVSVEISQDNSSAKVVIKINI